MNENNELRENVNDNGVAPVEEGGQGIFCLNIIGQIEGHYTLPSDNKTTKYEHVIPALVTVEQTSKRGLPSPSSSQE